MSKLSTPSNKPTSSPSQEAPAPAAPQAHGRGAEGPVQSNPRFRTAYGPRLRVPFATSGESRTKQSFKDECDINVIMRRYQQTGVLDHLAAGGPRYLDVTGLEYQSAMELVAAARTQFEELPSAVRAHFDNDPAAFLEYMEDPDPAELAELGLLTPEAVQRRKAEAEGGGATPPAPQAPKAPSEPQAQPETPKPASSPSPLVNKQ